MSAKMLFFKSCCMFLCLRENDIGVNYIHDKLLKVWVDETPSMRTLFRWIKEFSDGTRSGRPSLKDESMIVQIKNHIDNDPKVTLRALEEVMDTPRATIRRVLVENLQMKKICSIWVLYCLTNDHKAQRVMSAQNPLTIFGERSQKDILK